MKTKFNKLLTPTLIIIVCSYVLLPRTVEAVIENPSFDFMDGNGFRYETNGNDAFYNPTSYKCVVKYEGEDVKPFDDPSKIKFGGWTTYRSYIGATPETLYVSKANGDPNKYDANDFEFGKQYYAVWLNEYGNAVTFNYSSYWTSDFSLFENESKSAVCAGWTWDATTKTLNLENVTVAYLDGIYGEGFFFINKITTGQDVTVNVKGVNTFGRQIAFNDMKYKDATSEGNCLCSGIFSCSSLVFKGDGSLNIYDYRQGIASNESITFSDDFSGKITIYDAGKTEQPTPMCCLNALDNIVINNGTFNLINGESTAINAGNDFIFNGGELIATSNNAAIQTTNFKIADNMSITAKENTDGSGETIGIVRQDGQIYEYHNAKYISLKKSNTQKSKEKQYVDESCETVIGEDWTWDETLGVCKLKGYRIVNTSTK